MHTAAGLDINAPGINYRDIKFTTKNATTSEDSAANMIHFVLIALSAVILLFYTLKNRQPLVIALLFIVTLQMLLFCLYLKWQPWHSRLHLTFFLMWIPLLCYTFSISKTMLKVFYVATPFLFAYAILIVLHNTNRPYTNRIAQSRYQKYFINRPAAYDEYEAISAQIKQANYTNIGLSLGIDDWEYPLFQDCFSREMTPIYIQIDNLSKRLPQSAVIPECIISTNINNPFIDLMGKRFYNQDTKNTIIHLYK
jgi:predicted membrane metal-binding protein